MADTFYPRQTDYIQKLNTMAAAFNAGPYDAVPKTGGNMSGTLNNSEAFISSKAVYAASSGGANTWIVSPVPEGANTVNNINPALYLGVTGIPGAAFFGEYTFSTRAGWNGNFYKEGYSMYLTAYDSSPTTGNTPALVIVRGNGYVVVPKYVRIGTPEEFADTFYSVIQNPRQVSESITLEVTNSAQFNYASTNYGNGAACALRVSQTTNGRSINVPGTVNASGSDYAEYMIKSQGCKDVYAGQIIGITGDNKITDKYSLSVMFAVKSTNPSLVGGDTWAESVGQRPSALTYTVPVLPVRQETTYKTQIVDGKPITIVDVAGETLEDWEARFSAYVSEKAVYDTAVEKSEQEQAEYDRQLETARNKVDRIAYSGRVPVNVLGASSGNYILPVEGENDTIKGVAVKEDDITFAQYRKVVGKVINIEPDGRATVVVKLG